MLLLLACVLSSDKQNASQDSAPAEGGTDKAVDCSGEALELIALVNSYRAEQGRPAIAASSSLCQVGDQHAQDLSVNQPQQEPGCNLHSWSDQGSWTACCYTDDHARAQCMWDKPRELTPYPGNGYETAASGAANPADALAIWQQSPPHNDVLLSQDIWSDHPWGALGAGLYKGYAVLWFGDEVDPQP